jgi:hypothetical protein
MNAIKIMAIVLIVAGALGLVYGGFTYTKDTHVAKVGPIEMSFKDKENRQHSHLGRTGSDGGGRGPAVCAQVKALTRDWHKPVGTTRWLPIEAGRAVQAQTAGLKRKRESPVVEFQESRFPRHCLFNPDDLNPYHAIPGNPRTNRQVKQVTGNSFPVCRRTQHIRPVPR